jgi:hypothetical protein
MRSLLLVEEARIRFNTRVRYDQEPTTDEWKAIRRELLSFIHAFTDTGLTEPVSYERTLLVAPLISGEREKPSPFIELMINREPRPTIAEAIVQFRDYIEETEVGLNQQRNLLSLNELGRLVPAQQLAPVQFNIVENRVVISDQPPKSAEADKSIIQSALDHIRGSGEQLINNLTKSNCDRRLLESVSELHTQLVSEGNIIKVGLTNLACSAMGAQFRAELPDAIAGMLNAYNASVSLYVAQFPEWERFAQRAATLEIDEDDVAEVDAAAGEVIEALNRDSSLADPEVPKTIAFVRQFLSFPGASSKRAVFAMIRTIENLVSSIIRYSADFCNKTAENLVDAGSKAATKVILGLLGIALMGASGIGATATRAGAPWVQQAAEVVQKQIDQAME